MKQVVLNIPESKFSSFMKLMKRFENISISTKSETELKLSPSKKRIAKGLKKALQEVELHESGKVKLQSARDFLNGL